MARDSHHTYKLTYFSVKGRAEPIRLLFHYFNVDFKDHHVSQEEFNAMKKDAILEQLPLLEIDGGRKILADSVAIMRYLCKCFSNGFLGRSRSAAAAVDMHLQACNDLFVFYALVLQAEEGVEKTNSQCRYDTAGARFLRCHEKILVNNQNHLVFVGEEVTLADIFIFYLLWNLDEQESPLFKKEDYPTLFAFYDKMRELPPIKGYITDNWKSKLIS